MKEISDVKFGVLFCIAMLCIAIIVGCAVTGSTTPSVIPPEVETIIKNIGWIQGILIIGVVASIFACFNGAAKIGIPLLISSLIGYGLTSAMLFYAKLIAMMSLIGGVGLCGYMIVIKHRALEEIVKGVQNYRNVTIEHNDLDGTLDINQSKSTKKIVKKIKEKKINGSS